VTDVRRGDAADRAAAVGVLVRAFEADPLLRWVFPDDWPARGTAFFGHLFDTRLTGGEIRVTRDVSAVSLWNRPGGNTLDPAEWDRSWARASAGFTEDELERWRRFVDTVNPHTPAEEHWYLGVLGTHPDRQGEGLGSRVVRDVLEIADADGAPAYLETATESNLGFYARLGFDIRDDSSIPGGPRIWGLWRNPAG
jgi:GNAT superfamily N-acetyltransferase